MDTVNTNKWQKKLTFALRLIFICISREVSESDNINDNNRGTTALLPALRIFLFATMRNVHRDTVASLYLKLWTSRDINPAVTRNV